MKRSILLSLVYSLFFSIALQARDAEDIQPLLVGAATPEVEVASKTGRSVPLTSLTEGKRTVLVFYRGGWCPFCSTQMQGLAQTQDQLVELGYQIIGLSPDSPEKLSTVEKDGELTYALYSDASMSAAEAFGIDFTLDPETISKYKSFGIDLEKASGGLNKNKLPVPSVFIIGPDNEISFSYSNPDYKKRLSAELMLAAAKDGLASGN